MEMYFKWKLFFDYYFPAILSVAIVIGYIALKVERKISEWKAAQKEKLLRKGRR